MARTGLCSFRPAALYSADSHVWSGGGEYAVQQGMKIGYVTDLFGKMVWEAYAPSSGVVLYVCAVPSMKKAETVANIGVVAGKAP